ncbi:glutaredoxin family protein [Deinococcus antarcticus]|uniref:Glutaredoxin family protein n=1 Tax=Deinococcus antarcticus TaxID=1298767 RepID=A0ABV8A522_9DEIO
MQPLPHSRSVKGCINATHEFNRKGIEFEERNLTIPAVADEAKARYGVRVAPITVVGEQFFYGTFEQQRPELEPLFA